MNIVLDIDGTLIAEECSDIHPRPYLVEFLDFCFSTFARVSIWTAASKEWIDEVFKKLNLHTYPFDIVFIDKNCKKSYNYSCYGLDRYNITIVKPLKKLFKKKQGYTRHNTLVVDNTATTYRDNYGNAILVDTYYVGDDKTLLNLCQYLKILTEIYERDGTIRFTEKRGWNKELQN